MKTIKLKLFATLMSMVFCLSTGYQMSAQTFTAVASGDWSSSATWLVEAPGANETDAQIIIPAGITVTLDTDVQLDGNAGVLEVGGELNSGANYSLTINDGTLAGTGSITLDELTLEGSATALFAGSLTAETFNTSVTTLTLVADISVENNLNLVAGVVTLDTDGNLNLGSDAVIEVSGGAIAVGEGSISFSGNYSVIYSGNNSVSTGAELSGMTLTDLTIEVGAGQTVTLNNDVHIEGVLSIENGTLELNGNNLEITGDISASGEGELAANVAGSDISVSSGATVSGGLHFTTEENQINDFSIHVGSEGELTISGNVDVEGNLFLESGVLVLNDSELTINGDLTGEGMLSADAESALIINAEGGITSGLNFESDGQLIGDLTVNIGDGNTLTLDSDLTVDGTLHIEPGNTVDISGVSLTLDGDLTGNGQFSADNNTALAINVEGGTSAELVFDPTTQEIGDFTINIGSGNTLDLNSDLSVDGTLELAGGSNLDISGRSLDVNGDLTGDGSFSVDAGSDLAINVQGGTSGDLNFHSEANTIGNLTVNVGADNNVTLNSDLVVQGELELESGVLVLNDSELTINGDLTGEGMLSADAGSALTINAEGGISSGLNFESDGQLIGDLTVNIGDGNSISIDSDLTVDGTLHIEPGNTVDISGISLSLDGDLTGEGQFTADSNTALAINAEGGTSAELVFDQTTQEIGDLTINIGSGNTLDLNSDLSVDGTLELAGGSNLDISGKSLDVNGDLTGDGSFSTDADSDLAINVQGGTSGDLNFHSEANTIGNLTVNVGADNNVTLNSDLVVQEDLFLETGVLVLNNSELTINGDLSGEGRLSADAGSALTINAEGGITSGLNFESDGQLIGDLTVNIGDGNTLTLESDLTVDGTLHLESGNTLDISGVSLTLDGDFTGSGQFNANSETCLVISASQSITSALSFITDGNVVGKLTIDIDGGGSAHLDSDLVVSSELNLMNGQLVLNGYNIEVDGELNLTGDAEIHSTSDSDISLNLTGSPSGELNFSSDGNTVNQLWIEIDDGGSLTLGSELIIDGELAFGGNGSIRLNDFDLFVSGDAEITGSGGNSYIITAAGGSLVVEIQSEGSATFPVGTEANFSPAIIELNSGSSSGNLMVNVASGVYSEGYSGFNMAQDQSVVDATWFVNTDIDAGLDMDLEVWWNSEMEVNNFDRSEVYLSHFFEGSWDATATAEANLEADGMVSTRREGITALSPFAVFDQNTVVSIREITTVDLEVYPNPTSDKITITGLEESNNQINLNVYNSVGQLMNTYRFSGPNIELDLNGYENGNYFIRIYNDELDLIRQIVKVKP